MSERDHTWIEVCALTAAIMHYSHEWESSENEARIKNLLQRRLAKAAELGIGMAELVLNTIDRGEIVVHGKVVTF